MYKDLRRLIPRGVLTFALLLISVVGIFFYHPTRVEAATKITVTEINYVQSTITLKVNDGDTKVYYSDSKKTTWETVPGDINSDNTITMDISWITLTSNYVITFKANKSTEVISVTIPRQVTNFKATYNKVNGTVAFSNYGTRAIEWRKKDSSVWSTVNQATLTTELGYLNTNGASVYFRLAPINGTGISDVGYRASKEVLVAIPKKVTSPSIAINGSAFNIAVKKGMAYRTVNTDGSVTDWTTIGSTTNLLLKNIASKAMYTNASTAQSEVTLQFRTNATSSSQVSNIATVTVPVQEGPPNEDTYGISLTYSSSKTIALQVKAASATVPFEYTVVKENEELNYQTASWTAITSSTAVSLSSTTAPAGCHIYVRKKSVNATGDDDYAIASVEIDVSGTSGVIYPSAPTVSTVTKLISTAGVCKSTNSSSYLTFLLYSATATTVSSVHFLDAYGVDEGTVTCKSSVAKNTVSTGINDQYIITTKITSTESVDTVTQKLLYAKITLASSDVITSTDSAGILLYLYPATVVNNPTGDDFDYEDYTNSFNRIYMSSDTEDDASFKFRLDLGTAYVPSTTTIGSYTTQAVAISSIKYEGYTLINGTDYTVEYGSYVNDDEETVATATVTVDVSKFEKSSLINVTDTTEPLHIILNNGESLDDDIGITLINTATLVNAPVSWTITEGSLKETQPKTITNSDNTTTTVTEEVISYKLTLTLFNKNYGVSVSDVTWGGISVLGSTEISNGSATINLSNAKINKLSTSSTTTNNIVITLSNGFTINNGCKLTILNATN